MAERPEDLNLPLAVVQRIIKDTLPENVIVSKEAKQTIARASSVFVLYLTACAVTHSNKAKRKTLAIHDIMSALKDMDFDEFSKDLNDSLRLRQEFVKANMNNKSISEPNDAKKRKTDSDQNNENIEIDDNNEQQEEA